MDRFPQNCIIKIYYVNGISKEKLLSDQYFGVTSTCADPKALFVEKKGKKVEVSFDSNLKVELKTWSAEQNSDYDAPNKGFSILGFEAPLPKNSESFIKVKFKHKK